MHPETLRGRDRHREPGCTEGCRDAGLGEASLCHSVEGETTVPYPRKLPPACLAQAGSRSSRRQLFISHLHHLHAAPPLHLASTLFGSRFFPKQFKGLRHARRGFCAHRMCGSALVMVCYLLSLKAPGQASHTLTKPRAGILPSLVPHPGGPGNGPRCRIHPHPTAMPTHSSHPLPPPCLSPQPPSLTFSARGTRVRLFYASIPQRLILYKKDVLSASGCFVPHYFIKVTLIAREEHCRVQLWMMFQV